MAAGSIKLQAADLKVATVTFEDGAVGNVNVTVPKEGGVLAPLASPSFTGTPTAPTATAGDNSTKLATTAYVDTKVVQSTPSVRQTVLSGAVDTNGFSAFGGSTGATTVTTSTTIVATCADGNNNRIGTIVNPSWTGLSINGTMYLYLDIATDGTCTTGSTILAPTYRWGGADVVTNNKWTYNIQEAKGKLGNGSTASQIYRVFVGEVTVAGGVVTAIVWYALNGIYDSGWTSTLPTVSTRISKNNNLGYSDNYISNLSVQCLAVEAGYSIGDIFLGNPTEAISSATVPSQQAIVISKNISSYISGTTNTYEISHKSTGVLTNITASNWAYKITAQRGW